MKKLLLIISIILFTKSYSQEIKYSYGRVSEKELTEKESSISQESPAEIIYKDVAFVLDNTGNIELVVSERIKIYDKDKASDYLNYP